MSFRRTGLLCVALAMFSIAGGPCAVLQTVAWTEMFRDYCQRSGSVGIAVEQTFDGKHPCDLCRQIAQVKVQQQKQSPVSSQVQMDAKVKATCCRALARLECPEASGIAISTPWIFAGLLRSEPPPTPPPRAVRLTA